MYHLHCKGTHYEIGYTFGKRLKKFGINLLDNVPFEIDEERIQFADACMPHYEKYFPQVLEEIRGISDGNACAYESLCAVLFSMYCIVPSAHCSCFALRNQSGVYFARNSDFLIALEKLYMNVIYKFSNESYAYNANTTAFVEMEDGVNEHGLAIGLTSVYPKQIKAGLNAGMLLRLILETCQTVEDAIELLKKTPIASSQTFTLVDASGQIACIECSSTTMHVQQPQEEIAFVCATNRFHFTAMTEEMGDVEDDWFAKERYETMQKKLQQDKGSMEVSSIMSLLSGEYGFLCQYDRSTGKDCVWSIVYDVKHKTLYRVEGNPARKKFNIDKRFFIKS